MAAARSGRTSNIAGGDPVQRDGRVPVDAALEIDASEKFDKEGLVRAHERHRVSVAGMMDIMRNCGADDAVTHVAMTAVVESSDSYNNITNPVRRLSSLKPILVSRLRPGRHHFGQVLHGRLCVEPIMMVAVQTVMEDETGRAVKLSIYNAMLSSAGQQEACSMFPKGLVIAIKEPYLKRALDGCLIIRVDNPATHIVEGPAAGANLSLRLHINAMKHYNMITMSEQEMLSASRELRSEGNLAFQAQTWKLSVQLYTDALMLLLLRVNKNKGTISASAARSFTPAISQELVLVFSNRAEARLRLRHFEKAERDAFKALCLEPDHVKSLYRRGRALHGLHLYEEAALSFKKALELIKTQSSSSSIHGIKQELAQALEESKVCEKQASTGEYDFARICRDEQRDKRPICAEYMGPVVVGCAEDKAMGRGLLVTKDVECGELLLVTKAVADAKGTHHEETSTILQQDAIAGPNSRLRRMSAGRYHADISLQLMQLAMASERFKEQVYSLAHDNSPNVVANLHIPDMDLFRASILNTCTEEPNLFTPDEEISSWDSGYNVDINRISGVARTNSFYEPGRNRRGATMWLLPSFINHSCTPTACCILVSNHILFIRAARSLHKGQEITIPYMNSHNAQAPYIARARYCQAVYGFQCGCERCVFERSILPMTKPLELSLWDPILTMVPETRKEIVESLEWVMKKAGVIAEEKQKHWLRTSFAPAYVGMMVLECVDKKPMNLRFMEMSRGLQATLGGVETMALLMDQQTDGAALADLQRKMWQILYGKQSPAALKKILDARMQLFYPGCRRDSNL